MTHATTVRKIYQGVAGRRQMSRLFDRHAQRPNRWQGDDDGALFAGEWFEIEPSAHDDMLNILPPLWMRPDMFAMREFLTGSITSIFFMLAIDGRIRCFHGYCDLTDRSSPDRMKAAIIERESRPVRAMTRDERLEHIWSDTSDEYSGYADGGFPAKNRGKRIVMVFGPDRSREFKLLDEVSDDEIAAKLPVHLRHLPEVLAA